MQTIQPVSLIWWNGVFIGRLKRRAEVITELAFITDERLNALGDRAQSATGAPLEVQFDEFMEGGMSSLFASSGSVISWAIGVFSTVNSRGKGTKTRQRKTTVEQAAAVLLVAVSTPFHVGWSGSLMKRPQVQQGHIELTVNKGDPDTIETIIILPEAKKKSVSERLW
jgi:hypothetical protein